MPSSNDAAKRRRSDRAIPGAPRQTWYCSVSLCWKRRPGGGICAIGRLTCGVVRGVTALRASKRCSSETNLSCVMLPAAETTMLPLVYIDRW